MPHDLLLIWIVMSSIYCWTRATLTHIEDLGTRYVGEDVIIPWKYDNQQDMLFVDWIFESKDSIGKSVMSQAQGNDAVVHDGFNIQHNGNGEVRLINVTVHNTGNYSCVVTYTSSEDTDSVELTVQEHGESYLIACSVALATMATWLAITFFVIIFFQSGSVVCWKLGRYHILVLMGNIMFLCHSFVAATVVVNQVWNCLRCEATCEIDKCEISLRLAIVNYCLLFIALVETIIFIILIKKGLLRQRSSCLNIVQPGCSNESGYASDEMCANPLTKQHNSEKKVHKENSDGNKHDQECKGRPQPQPQPSGNPRPMPEIPSDRHKRGLSANYSDDRDKPLDDNILHTLPVVNKPKNALDPMNAEDQSKNAHDQPKKKKKKKDRDTSRSE